MRIEKYNAAGLKDFLDSEQYRTMPFVPVSEHRAESWLNNPRLKPEDIIIYLGFEAEDMIAYRCILPDRHGEIRFGWLSGNWVRSDKRRRGLASRLFEEAYADWGHQLMYTNYAPESKAVYDKSSRFELYNERPGIRYYQRSSSAGLLGDRRTVYRRSRMLLSMADGMLNTVQSIRIRMKRKDINDLDIEELPEIDLEALDIMEKNDGTGFCRRSMEDFNWITSYPWVKSGPQKDSRYFFSSVARNFKNICLKIRNPGGDLHGFLWMVLNGSQMTIPYAVFNPEAFSDESSELSSFISRVLNHYIQTNRVSYLTAYQSTITENFRPGPILGSRKMIQNYFATRDLIRQLPDPMSIPFQDGDGDVVFV